jgi:hypothetical protein
MKTPALSRPLFYLTTIPGVLFLTTSCDPDRSDGSGAKAAQGRAYELAEAGTALPKTKTNAGGGTTLPAQETQVPLAGPVGAGLPVDMTTAEAAGIHAARRDFLASSQHWSSDHAALVAWRAQTYSYMRARWAENTAFGGIGSSAWAVYHEMLMQKGAELDSACADLTKLQPQAKKEWDGWEAKRWHGYAAPLEIDRALRVPAISPAVSLQQRSEADFRARVIASVRPQLDQIEYLQRFVKSLMEQSTRVALEAKAGRATEAEAEAASAKWKEAGVQLHPLMSEVDDRAGKASEWHRQWAERKWAGYVIHDPSPGVDGTMKLQKPPPPATP